MFEEFYGMYEPKEQEVVALIKRCIGGGYHNKGLGTLSQRADLPSEDPPDEGRMGAKPGGAALVHLRGGQSS